MAGDTLVPVQPKPFRINFLSNVPDARSGLDTVNAGGPACAAPALIPPTNSAARTAANDLVLTRRFTDSLLGRWNSECIGEHVSSASRLPHKTIAENARVTTPLRATAGS